MVKQKNVKKEEKRKQAVLLLQRLLRGRAEQASMFEGKELRMALVEELRSTHALEVNFLFRIVLYSEFTDGNTICLGCLFFKQREEQQMKETEKAEVERLRREAAEAEAAAWQRV